MVHQLLGMLVKPAAKFIVQEIWEKTCERCHVKMKSMWIGNRLLHYCETCDADNVEVMKVTRNVVNGVSFVSHFV